MELGSLALTLESGGFSEVRFATAWPSALSDLIASPIERSRGQDWRYGDCSGREATERIKIVGCQQRATV